MVKTSPFEAGGKEAKIPRASPPKYQNINNKSNIVTSSIKTLKMVHIKKSLKKTEEMEDMFVSATKRQEVYCVLITRVKSFISLFLSLSLLIFKN